MRAMILRRQRHPLELVELPTPTPAAGQLLIRVLACGVCRTDLHVLDGDLKEPNLPIVLGHQIVGSVADASQSTRRFKVGDQIGVSWLGWS